MKLSIYLLVALALLCAPLMAQDKVEWSGVAFGLSGTIQNGELAKDWGANIGYPVIIKRANVRMLLVPQATYLATNGLTSGGAGVLAEVKSFRWGALMVGGSALPLEYSTTDSIKYNNTATFTLDALLFLSWAKTYPYFRLQVDFPTKTSSNAPVESRPAQQLRLMAGIAF